MKKYMLRNIACIGAAAVIAASIAHGSAAYAADNNLGLAYGVKTLPQTPTPSPTPISEDVPLPPENKMERRSASDRSSKTVLVTYYYCKGVSGIPAGDGGGYCGHFADGTKVTPEATGDTVACGYGFKLGTVFEIPGYGVVVCRDRGRLGQYQLDLFRYENTPPSSLPLGEREVSILD